MNDSAPPIIMSSFLLMLTDLGRETGQSRVYSSAIKPL
jgi:hypothetical protein